MPRPGLCRMDKGRKYSKARGMRAKPRTLGIGLGQSLLLQCKVGIEIDLRGLDRLMAEPKRNHGSIHTAL